MELRGLWWCGGGGGGTALTDYSRRPKPVLECADVFGICWPNI